MPEPTPCPNCGGIHEPGACPGKIEKSKEKEEKKVLTPEEEKEKKEREKEKLRQEIFTKISKGEFSVEEISQIPSDFHKEIALKLIEAGKGATVANNLEKFQGLDKEIALKLIEAGKGWAVANNLEKFQGLDHKEIALKLFEAGEGATVAYNLEKFQGLDHKEIALKLIEAGQEWAVADNLEKFQGLDYKEIVLKLIKAGEGGKVAYNLAEFQGLDGSVALALVEKGLMRVVARNLEKFGDLDLWSWGLALEKLKKTQDLAEREEHCPWQQELQPLLNFALEKKILFKENREDSELFLNFVKEFGAFNLPALLELYADLKRNPNLSKIKPESQIILKEALGEKILEKLPNSEAVINGVRRFKREFQEELLQDKISSKIETKIGQEIFNALRGTTRWEKGGFTEIVKLWQETSKDRPEVTQLSEGYKEKETAVVLLGEAKEIPPEEKLKEQNKILENKELQTSFQTLRDALKEGSKIEDPKKWWEAERGKILRGLEEDVKKTEAKTAAVPEKAKAGILKNIEKLNEAMNKIKEFQLKEGVEEKDLVDFMEKLSGVRTKGTEKFLRSFSALHISKVVPEGWRSYLESLSQSDGAAKTKEVEQMSEFLLQYLKEHYLHPEQVEHRTYHSPFSKDLRKTLEILWQMKEDPRKHVIIQSDQRLKSLTEGERAALKETQEIAFVPVRGLLRVFSGDVGDACYTSRHDELAKGEYSGITGIMMVTNRGEAQERLVGSSLFIETKTPDGRGVLVVRANNPRENLLGKVDVGSLIEETIKYAAEIAEKRGLDIVVVPLDGSSNSSSNRPKVSDYYRANFSDRPKVDLINEPETNFNSYNIWDSKGSHPVVKAWERKRKT